MLRTRSILSRTFFLSLLPLVASAVPVLQLDIAGGQYDHASETIVTSDDSFTVYAYGTPQGNNWAARRQVLGRTLYLSVALTPETSRYGAAAGSFTVNGVTYQATADMTYGVPPIESNGTAGHDGGDLGGHDIFRTHFVEIPFELTSASPTSGEYDTQDHAGQGPIAGDDMYYAAFTVNTSGLAEGYELHFDLYGVQRRHGGDRDIDIFAPFSHDAATIPGGRPVPEPTAAIVFAAGLAATRFAGRRR